MDDKWITPETKTPKTAQEKGQQYPSNHTYFLTHRYQILQVKATNEICSSFPKTPKIMKWVLATDLLECSSWFFKIKLMSSFLALYPAVQCLPKPWNYLMTLDREFREFQKTHNNSNSSLSFILIVNQKTAVCWFLSKPISVEYRKCWENTIGKQQLWTETVNVLGQ